MLIDLTEKTDKFFRIFSFYSLIKNHVFSIQFVYSAY